MFWIGVFLGASVGASLGFLLAVIFVSKLEPSRQKESFSHCLEASLMGTNQEVTRISPKSNS